MQRQLLQGAGGGGGGGRGGGGGGGGGSNHIGHGGSPPSTEENLIVFGSIFVLFCLFWIWRYFRNAQLVAHQWDDVPGGNTIAGRQEWVTREGALRNDAAGSYIDSTEISVTMHDRTELVEKSMCAFPSGKWKGYYYQYGKDHGLLPFQFNFEGMRVTAQGSDDVGDYSIEGICTTRTQCHS